MRGHAFNLNTWPLKKNGEPTLTCSEDAIYFGHLISKNNGWILLLKKLRRNAYFDMAKLKEKVSPNFDRLFELSFRAQMYREALEEVERIDNEQINTILDGPPLEGA